MSFPPPTDQRRRTSVIVKTETRRARSAARPDLIRTTASSSSAYSRARVRRESLSRHSGESGVSSSLPARHCSSSSRERGRHPVDVVRGDDGAGAGAADERRGLPVGRHHGEDRALGREVLEDLAREHAAPAAVVLRDEEQEGVRVALEREHLFPGAVRDDLDAVAEPEPVRIVLVGRREAADEAGDHVAVRLRQGVQERPGVAASEEAAGVRDAQALPGPVLEPVEVLEVASVGDHLEAPRRPERLHLCGDGVRGARRPRPPGGRRAARARPRRGSGGAGGGATRSSRGGRPPSAPA